MLSLPVAACVHFSHAVCFLVLNRYLFRHWTAQEEGVGRGSVAWWTASDLLLGSLLKLQGLENHGWGSLRLINARESKPSELAIMAMPPVYARLTTRRQGDRVLSLSFHMALFGQVRQLK